MHAAAEMNADADNACGSAAAEAVPQYEYKYLYKFETLTIGDDADASMEQAAASPEQFEQLAEQYVSGEAAPGTRHDSL